jgi:hypothetical protein
MLQAGGSEKTARITGDAKTRRTKPISRCAGFAGARSRSEANPNEANAVYLSLGIFIS